MSTTATRPRFTRHADEYAVSTTIAETTVYLGTVRLVGQTWIAYPQAGDQGSHLYVNEHRTRANAAAALDTAMRAALAADSAEALTETDCTAQPVWASGGPGKSAYSDYRWECACGHRYGNATPADGDVSAQHAAHLAEDAAQDAPVEFAPGMYRVQITVTNRDGVHSATEDMNPAAIALARSRPGWTVEILGPSSVTIVEDDDADDLERRRANYLAATTDDERRAAAAALNYDLPLGCSDCNAHQWVASSVEEEAFWDVHGGVGVPCTAPGADATPALATRYAPALAMTDAGNKVHMADAIGSTRLRTLCDQDDIAQTIAALDDTGGLESLLARLHANRVAPSRLCRKCFAIRTRAAYVEFRSADPRTVAGTPENIDARADARARGERADQIGLGFDLDDRQAMAEAQVRAKTGGELTLFG